MNLVPIDGGPIAPATDPVTGGGSGEFASIMTGLLAGDTQIAAVIDLPLSPTDVSTEHEDTPDELGALLELVGTPPAGIAYTRPPLETSPPSPDGELAMPPVVEEEGIGSNDARLSGFDDIPPATDDLVPDLAPITQDLGRLAPPAAAPVVGAPESVATPVIEMAPTPSRTASPSVGPVVAPPTTAAPTAHAPTPTTARPIAVAEPSGATISDDTDPLASPVTDRLAAGPDAPDDTGSMVTAGPDGAPPDPEFDPGSWTRSVESVRTPAETARQSVTVGIARRVEEAIAALANKPDPKIVTLQLDELDGVRLTVALRPDGVHLTSTGDPRLTVDIERALASRGFDLSSDGRRRDSRETPNEPESTRWRPQSAPRRRTTDPDAITL